MFNVTTPLIYSCICIVCKCLWGMFVRLWMYDSTFISVCMFVRRDDCVMSELWYEYAYVYVDIMPMRM